MHNKIRKLLNMTVENGCTEDEQETALRMAASLAAREGIELSSLAKAPVKKATTKGHWQEFKPHQALAAHAAAVLYGVECNAYSLGAKGIMFVGREELIELAEETMFWLFRQVEELYKSSLPKGLSQRERAEYRKTFKAACAQRTYERALKVMRDMKTTGGQTGSTALVVTGYFDQLKAEQVAYWAEREQQLTPEQRKLWEKKARSRSIPTGRGTRAGYQAGDHVKLRKILS